VRNRFRAGVVALVTGLCLLGSPAISEATTTPTITPAFIAKVNTYCSAEEASFNKVLGKFPYPNFNPNHPDVKTMRLVGKHFEKALSLRHAIPAQLKALGEPQVGQSQWDELRLLATQSDDTALTQIRVALAGNVKGFIATVNQTGSIHNELVKEAQKDGFAKSSPCGEVF